MARLRNSRTGAWLAEDLRTARTIWQKTKGLLGRKSLASGAGLYIVPCQAIHSFFMQFPFDAVFVDKQWRVLHLIDGMPAWRMSRFVWKAEGVVELPAGVIGASQTVKGDALEFIPD